MSSIVISGDTSGSVTLLAPTIAGTTTVTLPVTSMNIGNGGGGISTNTAMGASALNANTTGSYNCAFGQATLQLNTTGALNSAFGQGALYANTTGSNNTAIGLNALVSNTTASNNTAVGYQAGYNLTTGGGLAGQNVFIGQQAGSNVVAYSRNTCVGYQAGNGTTTADRVTAIGHLAGNITTGGFNCFVGGAAGLNNTSGASNNFFGDSSGYLMTTGSKNTIIGAYSGNQGGIDIRTSNNRIVISDGDGNPRGYFDSSGTFYVGGFSGSANGTGGLSSTTIGNGNQCLTAWNTDVSGTRYLAYFGVNGTFLNVGAITSNGSTTSYVTTSDYRLKENVAPMVGALETVSKLKPVTYRWKESGIEDNGFIAHELQEVLPNAVVGEKDAVNEDGSIDPQAIDTSFLVATLTAAIQELNAKVIELEAKLESK